jgi:glutathione S-transferase
LALNIKGIEHQTHWLEFADIQKTLKEAGVPPSDVASDGTPRYTIPAIYDPSTGAKVADSLKIIRYLNETYPDTPVLEYPLTAPDSVALSNEFEATLQKPLRFLWALIAPAIIAGQSGESSAKFRASYRAAVKQAPEELLQDEERVKDLWARVEEGFSSLDTWIQGRASGSGGGAWVTGPGHTLFDVLLGGGLGWIVGVTGEESDEWKKIKGWNGGRWEVFWDQLKPYVKVL